MINIIINGANGRMGKALQQAILKTNDINVVAKTGREDNLDHIIKNKKPDIVIDLTSADTVLENTQIIINNNISPIIGTSGLTRDNIEKLEKLCDEKSLSGLIIPNFSIAAVLMMKYAEDAAKYLPNVEIIESHHVNKVDKPSGTARRTAEVLANTMGKSYSDIPIHSIRSPGVIADQKVVFGADSESLSIEHRTLDRTCFMPGIILACRKVKNLSGLKTGLEWVMD